MDVTKTPAAPFGAITVYGLVVRIEAAVLAVLDVAKAARRAAQMAATRRRLEKLSPEMRRDIGVSDDLEAEIARLARRHRP